MNDKIYTSTTTTQSSPVDVSIESIRKAQKDANDYRLFNFALGGIKILPDEIGMLCGDNEYVVVCGKELFKKLQTGLGRKIE